MIEKSLVSWRAGARVRRAMLAACCLAMALSGIAGGAAAQSGSGSDGTLDSLLGPSTATPVEQGAPSPQPEGTAQNNGNTTNGDAPASSGTSVSTSDAQTPATTAASPPAAATETVPVTNPEPAKAARGSNRLIEEIIVTAQKRDENIKDVPISISAFNADYLGAKGVIAQQDLPKITPGLTFSAPVGFSTAYIRGIGSDAFILADPLVVTYIDGVYFPASTTQFQDFGSVQKVEIDKGPQGTLFGRNALGGVISITTSDPDLSAFKASANTTFSDYTGTDSGRYASNNSLYLSVPILNNLAVSASGLYDRDDPYFDDGVGPSNGHRLIDSGRAYAYRFKLLYQPIDNVKLRLNVYKFHTNDPQRNFAVNTAPSVLAVGVRPQNPYDGGNIDGVPVSSDDGITYFGSLDAHTHWANIQFLGSYQSITAIRSFDFDASTVPLAYFEAVPRGNQPGFFSANRTAELRFLSNDNAPDWLQVVGGVYAFEQSSGVGNADFQAGGTNLSLGQIASVNVPGVSKLYNTLVALGLGGIAPQGVQVGFSGGLKDKSVAGYLQTTLKPFDWTSLTLGARYTDDKKCVIYANQYLNQNFGAQTPLFHYDNCGSPNGAIVTDDSGDPQYKSENKNFDPKITLNFRPGEGLLGRDPLLYLSYQTASIGDTFNVISLIQSPSLALGSKIKAYEGGFKTTLYDDLISLDGAGFYYKETNAQEQVVSLQSGGAVHFENAKGLQTVGGELSTVTQILPSLTNNGLVFTLGMSYLDSTYTAYPNASGFNPTTGIYSDKNDFTGKTVEQTPKFTAAAGLNQTFQIPRGPLEFGVDYYFNSGFFFLAQNTPNTRVDTYKTLGFTASYLYEPLKLRITAFGRNVLNEHYLVARFTNDFGTDDFPAQLSSYGVTLHVDY